MLFYLPLVEHILLLLCRSYVAGRYFSTAGATCEANALDLLHLWCQVKKSFLLKDSCVLSKFKLTFKDICKIVLFDGSNLSCSFYIFGNLNLMEISAYICSGDDVKVLYFLC